MNPGVRLHVGHKHARFLSMLTRFVDYYSLFWGPGVISTIDEPGVRLRFGHKHSLFWLAHSGPFRGLLLTVLGPRSDVHD